jgi:hypothetical protein
MDGHNRPQTTTGMHCKNKIVQQEVLGVNLKLSAPADLMKLLLRKCETFLPTGVNTNVDLGATNGAVHVSVKRGKPKLCIRGSSATFSSIARDESVTTDTLITASRLIEVQLNKRGIFCMNAGAVSYGDQAVLLLGPYGAGKTSTAVRLCLGNNKIHYITGNRIFLDSKNNEILGGMDSCSLRLSSIAGEFVDVAEKLPEQLGIDTGLMDASQFIQTGRYSFNSAQIGLTRATFPVKVKAIALITKMDRAFLSFYPAPGGPSEILQLHGALCEYSEKGYVMLGPRLFFPDIFSKDLKAARLDYAVRIAETIPMVYMEGRLRDICSNIEAQLFAI